MIRFAGRKFDINGLGLPTACPCCGGDLLVLNNGEVECVNPACQQKVIHKFAYWFMRLGVKGAGPAFFEEMSKDCKTLSEVMNNFDVNYFNKWAGGKNGEKVFASFKQKIAGNLTVATYLSWFDLRGFGERKLTLLESNESFKEIYASKDKAKAFKLLPSRMALYITDDINGISADTMAAIASAINDNIDDIVGGCAYFGKQIQSAEEEKPAAGGKLAGQSFCFHGKLSESRKALEAEVIENGGTIGAVNKSLSFLVCNEQDDGSNKTAAAIKLGIKMITEAQFKAML